MSFLNPWAIALGLVAAGLPVLIHWLTKPRPVVLSLSTLRFVMQAVQERRARHRLRDFVILALRTVAVLLLAAAIARPLAAQRPLITRDSAGDACRVILLDVSQSMAARAGGIQVFERARSQAASYLAYRPGLAASLVLAGASARAVFDQPSGNFAALRAELGRAAPRPEQLNVQAALEAASRMLAGFGGSSSARRELVIVSDFQRSNWASADFSAIPRQTSIQLEFAAPPQVLPNLAILHVGGSGRAEQGRPMTIEVEVSNFSDTPRQIQVELTIGDASYRLEGPCAASAGATLSTDVVPHTVGWHAGRARLIGLGDALLEDDARSFAIEVGPAPTYALVTRQPAVARMSSSYYLERALAPLTPRGDQPQERVVRIDPIQFERDALAASDLIVLDHPGKLSEAVVPLLAGWLRRGRGLLYVVAEPIDAVNLKRLADAAGTDLRLPVEFAPPPAGAVRSNLFLADYRRDQPPFLIFGDSLTTAFAPLRFAGGLTSRPTPDALAEDLRASFSDRTAFLVVSACGTGSLAILNADLGASNLATSPVFVPFLGELASVLLGRRSIGAPVPCGESFVVPLPAAVGSAAGLTVDSSAAQAPVLADHAGEIIEDREGVVWRSTAAGPPDVYRVRRTEHTLFALATAIPDIESNLAPLAPAVFRSRLMGERRAYYRTAGQPDDEVDDRWAWLAVACVACLGAELITLKAFRT